jgi:hypothetical protein
LALIDVIWDLPESDPQDLCGDGQFDPPEMLQLSTSSALDLCTPNNPLVAEDSDDVTVLLCGYT